MVGTGWQVHVKTPEQPVPASRLFEDRGGMKHGREGKERWMRCIILGPFLRFWKKGATGLVFPPHLTRDTDPRERGREWGGKGSVWMGKTWFVIEVGLWVWM